MDLDPQLLYSALQEELNLAFSNLHDVIQDVEHEVDHLNHDGSVDADTFYTYGKAVLERCQTKLYDAVDKYFDARRTLATAASPITNSDDAPRLTHSPVVARDLLRDEFDLVEKIEAKRHELARAAIRKSSASPVVEQSDDSSHEVDSLSSSSQENTPPSNSSSSSSPLMREASSSSSSPDPDSYSSYSYSCDSD
ncbi:unnamed protein product, partial [Mesorhabditis spiculigera]